MTEKQYEYRRATIMARIYAHEEAYADGRPKYPRCLRYDMAQLSKLEEEWRQQQQSE